MTSVAGRVIKQNMADLGYFMPVSSLQNIVYTFTPGSGAGGSFAQGQFPTVAAWATITAYGKTAGATGSGNPYLSSINQGGAGILKDMGKTVVSAGRTFRKVQLVVNSGNAALYQNLSTNGVAGGDPYQTSGTTPIQDFLTGYIELGFEGTGPSAPVVPYGR